MLPATPIITIGSPLIELSSVDSTNIYAMEQIRIGQAISGSCYTTPFQTQGKGQHGRVWESEKGENLLSSYVLELKSLDPSKNWGPEDQIGLSAAVAIAAKSFFTQYAGTETLIKLPNDIYWRDRKAGGILIENILKGTAWTWTVIGIGININQTKFNPDAPNAVSLKQITGRQWEITRLRSELNKALTTSIQDWIQVGDAATIEKMKPLWTSS